ncbi:entericidin A [Lysobacter helvus]|uniref:Entericidin A n=3 Tax=Lysobacterales TaxID=135614 RepID=A0ABN6FRF7_9GAMM|nr:entericidin A [Lysobacter caseinilyticus]BCT95068.1 entericidin A [Lysobacter helvus]
MKQSAMKRTFALMLLALFSMNMLAACNTVAGAGKDVQKAGEKVETKAEDCKDSHC